MRDNEKAILNLLDGKVEDLHINFDRAGTRVSFFNLKKKLRITIENSTYEFTKKLVMIARGK